MDEKKIKQAFFRVKTDMDAIGSDISQVRMQVADLVRKSDLEIDITDQIKKLEKMDFDNFTKNMEKEFSQINSLIREFNIRFKETSEFMNKHQQEIEVYNKEISELKKRTKENQSKTENTNLDISMMNSKLAEMSELISEKVDLEINSLRLEFTDDIARLYDNIARDKIDSEIDETKNNPPKKEITKKKAKKTEKVKEIPVPNKNKLKEEKEDGKFKKAVKWLFVDEDEEDESFENIKGEIKKGQKL